MPIRFIIGLVLLLIALILYVVAKKATFQIEDDKKVAKIASYINGVIAVALILIFSACLTVVGTRRIGIVTDFGRPVDSLSNGIHLKLPWQRVSELDGSIQTDSYIGEGDGDASPCLDIRIGNESTACVDVTVRWQIPINDAEQIYRDFRNMDNIRASVVTRDLTASLNAILGTFNPLDAVNLDTDGGLAGLDDLAVSIEEDLTARSERRVNILSVTLPLIRYDNNTQDVLNDYATEIGRTRVAEQREETAEAQGRANEALAESVSNDPNVLVSRCIESIFAMIEAGFPVPPAMNCWPGEDSAVVIPTATTSPG